MWGTAGTLLAANIMKQWTGEPRWQQVFQLQAQRMLKEWEAVEGTGHLWTPELYGGQLKYLGPVHGMVGNLIPLIKGQQLLDRSQYQDIVSKAMTTLVNTAIEDEQFANWPAIIQDKPAPKAHKFVQYCHGAPGIITSVSELPMGQNVDFDRLLEKGGELIWSAGALKKGSGLCHGTGGNGYALLKLYLRTGNIIWLERARSFAMHSIEQYQLAQKLYGQGRYNLWNGDIGLAIYLWDCLQGQAAFPTIDIF